MKPTWLRAFLRELSDKWQIPALILAVAVVGVTIAVFVSRQKQLAREHSVGRCERFVAKGEYRKAIELGAKLLADSKIEGAYREKLHSVSARAWYELIRDCEHADRDVLMKIQKHLTLSVGDRSFTAEDHELLAEVAIRLGEAQSAVDHLRTSLALGHPHRVAILRKILDMLPRTGRAIEEEYASCLERLLNEPGLNGADLVWASSRKAQMLFAKDRFDDGVSLIHEVLPRVAEADQSELRYALAYGEYWRGRSESAERALRLLLDRLGSSSEIEAKATLLLATICLKEGRGEEGLAFFKKVILGHRGSEYESAGELGCAECLAMVGRLESSRRSYKRAFALLDEVGPNAVIGRGEILDSLERLVKRFIASDDLEQALGFARIQYDHLDSKNDLGGSDVLGRLGLLERRLAETLSKALPTVGSSQKAELLRRRIGEHYSQAGQCFLELADRGGLADRGSADALWQAALCYQQVPDPERSVAVLQRLVDDWPNGRHLEEALYRLARAYQASGQYEQASRRYQRLVSEYPRTYAGQRSVAPLARCYMAMGPDYYGLADQVLTAVVDDTSDQKMFEPDSIEFREALFLLGKLRYYEQAYEKCVARLEEAVQRYPNDRSCAEATFLMAESYRKLAETYHGRVDRTNDYQLKTQLTRRRKDHLLRAEALYGDAIDAFVRLDDRTKLEQTYLKLAYIWCADCLYDLERFDEAIQAYQQVVDRYEDSQVALAAYVQIINAYHLLGRGEKMGVVLERMKWLVRRLPDSAFSGPGAAFSRRDWQDWIEWNYRSGLLEHRSEDGLKDDRQSLVRGSDRPS